MRTIQIGLNQQNQVLYEDTGYRLQTAANWRETAQADRASGELLQTLSCVTQRHLLPQRCLSRKHPKGCDPPNDNTNAAASPVSEAPARRRLRPKQNGDKNIVPRKEYSEC